MDYTITPQYHDKKGCYIYVVRLSDRVDKEDFATLSDLAKSHKGYYSSFRGVNGFVFKTEEIAEKFCEDMKVILDTIRSSSISSSLSAPTKEDSYTPLPSTPSGMELHKALRAVIQTEGEAIITEVRLVNILDDFKAYLDMPSVKYILRAIIADGFAQKLLAIGEWNNEALSLVSRFATATGFMPELVETIFKSLAYGLEWIENVSISQEIENQKVKSNASKANTSNTKRAPKKSAKSVEKMDDDEFEDFIWSKIEWDHSIEKNAGLVFKNYQISSFNWYTGFCILFEIEGKMKTEHLDIKYTAYDSKGRLRAHGTGFFRTNSSNDKIGEINVHFNKPLDTLSRVIFEGSYSFSFD